MKHGFHIRDTAVSAKIARIYKRHFFKCFSFLLVLAFANGNRCESLAFCSTSSVSGLDFDGEFYTSFQHERKSAALSPCAPEEGSFSGFHFSREQTLS
jgi:hypothetical protein